MGRYRVFAYKPLHTGAFDPLPLRGSDGEDSRPERDKTGRLPNECDCPA